MKKFYSSFKYRDDIDRTQCVYNLTIDRPIIEGIWVIHRLLKTDDRLSGIIILDNVFSMFKDGKWLKRFDIHFSDENSAIIFKMITSE